MAKLTGNTSLARRQKRKKEQSQKAADKNKITTVATRRNITTGTSPVTMRLPENDKIELNLWLEALSLESGKNITNAKLLRGLIKMRNKINISTLIKSIDKAV
ncbi:MAG: hypothetical protein R3203_10495 [Pseudoalteromonas tetraodonis]|nr:hypothetical protein [Pseudoalteromonas tetraodonis]